MSEANVDEGLLNRFLAGEPGACRQAERWAREVLRFRGLGLSREDHEDIVQTALVSVFRRAAQPDFVLRHGLRALLRTIVIARAIDLRRRRRALVEVDDTLRDPAPDPAQARQLRSRWEALQSALALLAEGCRDLIRMHFFEERPYADIAARTGRTAGALRVRMYECIKQLRRHAGEPGTS